MTTLTPNNRASNRVRLNKVNQIVNLIAKRETARVDFFEAAAELDNLLANTSPALREFAQVLSDGYKVSQIDVPALEPPVSVQDSSAPEEAKAAPKSPEIKRKRKKSQAQQEKSRARLAKLREKKKAPKTSAETQEESASSESSSDDDEVAEEEVPAPKKSLDEELARDREEARKEKKRKSFSKSTGLQLGDSEDISREQAALSAQIGGAIVTLSKNKKGRIV